MMKPFTFFHVSDIHESAFLSSPRAWFDKRLLGFLNGAAARRFRREIVRAAAEKIAAYKPDLVLFTGDASTCSQKREFDQALEDLSPIRKAGIRILYVPGNHDRYVKDPSARSALDSFLRTLTDGAQTLEQFPFSVKTGSVEFVLIDSALPTVPWMSCGRVTPESLAYLETVCREKNCPVVLLSHFPVLHRESGVSGLRRKLYGAERIRTLAQNGKIDLILCGHIHKGYSMLSHSGRGEHDAGSLAKYGTFSRIVLEENQFQITSESL